jgi:hypothetical protein
MQIQIRIRIRIQMQIRIQIQIRYRCKYRYILWKAIRLFWQKVLIEANVRRPKLAAEWLADCQHPKNNIPIGPIPIWSHWVSSLEHWPGIDWITSWTTTIDISPASEDRRSLVKSGTLEVAYKIVNYYSFVNADQGFYVHTSVTSTWRMLKSYGLKKDARR